MLSRIIEKMHPCIYPQVVSGQAANEILFRVLFPFASSSSGSGGVPSSSLPLIHQGKVLVVSRELMQHVICGRERDQDLVSSSQDLQLQPGQHLSLFLGQPRPDELYLGPFGLEHDGAVRAVDEQTNSRMIRICFEYSSSS